MLKKIVLLFLLCVNAGASEINDSMIRAAAFGIDGDSSKFKILNIQGCPDLGPWNAKLTMDDYEYALAEIILVKSAQGEVMASYDGEKCPPTSSTINIKDIKG